MIFYPPPPNLWTWILLLLNDVLVFKRVTSTFCIQIGFFIALQANPDKYKLDIVLRGWAGHNLSATPITGFVERIKYTTGYYSSWQFNVFSLENDIVLESKRQLRICTFGLSYKNILVLLDIGTDGWKELHTISGDLVFVINGKILDVSV